VKISSLMRYSMMVLMALLLTAGAQAQEAARKVKTTVAPVYPELAKRMNVSGTVKVTVTIAPSGGVTGTKVVGGHPLLVDAAVDAVKRWKYESGPEESKQTVEIKFTL
jgi:TonB family protein